MIRDAQISSCCRITGKSGSGHLLYYVFDLLHFQGHDLTGLPLLQEERYPEKDSPVRRRRYASAITWSRKVSCSSRSSGKRDWRGSSPRQARARTRSGRRSRQWLKVKTQLTQEGVIAGFTATARGQKAFRHPCPGRVQGGRSDHTSAMREAGSGRKSWRKSAKSCSPSIQKECPFNVKPETNTPATWVKPELVCEVGFHRLDRGGGHEASGLPAAARG